MRAVICSGVGEFVAGVNIVLGTVEHEACEGVRVSVSIRPALFLNYGYTMSSDML